MFDQKIYISLAIYLKFSVMTVFTEAFFAHSVVQTYVLQRCDISGQNQEFFK